MTYLQAIEEHKIESDRISAEMIEKYGEDEAEYIFSFYGYKTKGKESQSAIEELEQSLSVSIPGPLHNLYLQQGGIEIFAPDSLQHLSIWIPTIKELNKWCSMMGFDSGLPTLYDTLVHYLSNGSSQAFEKNLGHAQALKLKEYFVFGTVNHRYEDMTYLIFSKAGGFGTVRSEHDDEEWYTEIFPLCEGRLKKITIDEMLAPHIMNCTKDLQRRYAENDW